MSNMVRRRPLILVKPGHILELMKGTGRRTTRRLVRVEELLVTYRAKVIECDSDGNAAGAPFEVLTLPRFHVHQTYAAFMLRSKSAGDR
jgi:hypothetical protein